MKTQPRSATHMGNRSIKQRDQYDMCMWHGGNQTNKLKMSCIRNFTACSNFVVHNAQKHVLYYWTVCVYVCPDTAEAHSFRHIWNLRLNLCLLGQLLPTLAQTQQLNCPTRQQSVVEAHSWWHPAHTTPHPAIRTSPGAVLVLVVTMQPGKHNIDQHNCHTVTV